MSQKTSVRTYGKRARKPQPGKALAELDVNVSMSTVASKSTVPDDTVTKITKRLKDVTIHDEQKTSLPSKPKAAPPAPEPEPLRPQTPTRAHQLEKPSLILTPLDTQEDSNILTWEDVCPFGDRIEKIAEASYAEVYRITNDRGTSIIKVIRLESPIKPQTKAQQKSGLVDEEPHSEDDLAGELQISELLADIPGFVIYKEKYTVQGKTTPALLETHQTFHKKMKRKDPDRLQFYPSPSRYLNDTKFLVVELGDAGVALEDLEILSVGQIWDIFLNVAVALARAENLVRFEHRDLHEGNVCVREVRSPEAKTDRSPRRFGYSGLDVTILDYGLSRAENVEDVSARPIAQDLEKDLGLFTSTHAPQCKVYRQMRSYLLKGDRICLPPKAHNKPYEKGINGRVSWKQHHAYTNVLWLAYLYAYLVKNFKGGKKELAIFRRESLEFWTHLNPEAPPEILSFSSAEDVVEFAVEAGWIEEDQLIGPNGDTSFSHIGDESIIEIRSSRRDDVSLRRSPRRRVQPLVE
ncbi:hypothetical protein DHEL01_v212415 [Diaporthe helianthi]|uniref:non-specific serine/threonine protein kinase n=1 Tax=Diaporthe helianthi TaxID=158607 RepID=A0A2P5HG15_DIAHE|nr:hypothetical protein DHEL01_v212415 [Diaporthe helianthi]